MNSEWHRRRGDGARPGLHTAIILSCLVPAGPAAAQRFTPPLVPPATRYVINAVVDLESGQLTGDGLATVRNIGAHDLRALAIHWFDWRSGSYEIIVDGKSTRYPSSAESIEIALARPLEPGDSLDLRFRFSRALGDLDRGFGIQHWFPQLWWGYETHASYDVGVSAPAELIVGATGRRDAASGRYRADHVRTFGLYFARGFEQRERMAGPTLVRTIFRPDMRECAELVLEAAAEAVEFYRQRFRMYPQNSLTIVPGGSSPAGGYPYATAMVVVHGQEACAQKPRDTHWRWIAAHEVAHQYWIEHVLEKDPEQGYGWLMIGLGIWTDREYARAHGMPGLHGSFLDSYANTVRQGLNTTIEIGPEELRKIEFDYNTQVTHYKGFGVVSALAAIVGSETFDRILQRCLTEYSGRRLGSAEFRSIAESESGQDLSWFFVPMLRTSQYASYEVTDTATTRDRGAYTTRVTVASNGEIRLPVPVEVRFTDATRQRQLLDPNADQQTMTFRSAAAVDSIVIDPAHEFPLVMPAPEVDSARLTELVAALPWTGGGDKSLRLYRRAIELDVTDRSVMVKLGLTLADARRYEQALGAFDRVLLASPDSTSTWRFGALVWRGILNDLLGRRVAAVQSYQQALALPGNPTLQHSQFGLTLDRQWVEERLRVPFVWR